MRHYIRGTELSPRQVERVKAAFVHRNTHENRYPSGGRRVSDAEWIETKAFSFYKDGEAAGCIPVSALEVIAEEKTR